MYDNGIYFPYNIRVCESQQLCYISELNTYFLTQNVKFVSQCQTKINMNQKNNILFSITMLQRNFITKIRKK